MVFVFGIRDWNWGLGLGLMIRIGDWEGKWVVMIIEIRVWGCHCINHSSGEKKNWDED